MTGLALELGPELGRPNSRRCAQADVYTLLTPAPQRKCISNRRTTTATTTRPQAELPGTGTRHTCGACCPSTATPGHDNFQYSPTPNRLP